MHAGRTNRKQKPRKTKIHLVFDEAKRRDFLTGFHRRKLQRKKEAKVQLEQALKDERKRLKADARESFKKLVVSYRPIPELEDLLEDKYEDEDVSVKVMELSTNSIAEQNNWIGANQSGFNEDVDNQEESNDEEEDEIPGMALKQKKVRMEAMKPQLFTSKREIKKTLKNQAMKNLKCSKVFQRKTKLDRQQHKKSAIKEKQKQQRYSSKTRKHNKKRHSK